MTYDKFIDDGEGLIIHPPKSEVAKEAADDLEKYNHCHGPKGRFCGTGGGGGLSFQSEGSRPEPTSGGQPLRERGDFQIARSLEHGRTRDSKTGYMPDIPKNQAPAPPVPKGNMRDENGYLSPQTALNPRTNLKAYVGKDVEINYEVSVPYSPKMRGSAIQNIAVKMPDGRIEYVDHQWIYNAPKEILNAKPLEIQSTTGKVGVYSKVAKESEPTYNPRRKTYVSDYKVGDLGKVYIQTGKAPTPTPKPQPKPEPKTESTAKPAFDPSLAIKPYKKRPQPQSYGPTTQTVKPTPKVEPKPQPKVEPKPQPKIEAKPQAKPATTPTTVKPTSTKPAAQPASTKKPTKRQQEIMDRERAQLEREMRHAGIDPSTLHKDDTTKGIDVGDVHVAGPSWKGKKRSEMTKEEVAECEKARKREEGCPKVRKSVELIKLDDDQRLIYGVVLVPDVEDLQGDICSKEDIQEAAHEYLVKSRLIKAQHKAPTDAEVVECYIAPIDIPIGKGIAPAGSWILVTKVNSSAMWTAVKKGEITGYSIGGRGKREEI